MVADAYPLVVVESDTARVSGLQLVKSDTARVSVLPVAGCKFPAVVFGEGRFGCGWPGRWPPPCLRVDSEETLLTLTDERSQLACAAPGVTPVDSSEKGVPVRELRCPSVLGEPLVDCPQEPMPGKKSLDSGDRCLVRKAWIQVTASVWMPFERVYDVVSGDVVFDSFGMAPWDAGGMHSRTRSETLRTMLLQWLMRLLCRPVIMHGLDRTMTMNTENGLDTIMMITTDSPRLAVTPGEWYVSIMLTLLIRDLRQMNSAMFNSRTELGFPQVDSAAADSGAVEMDDLIFRRLSLPP